MASGGMGANIDDFYANWDFDRAPYGFVGGSAIGTSMYGGRPIVWRPVQCGTLAWGSKWKEETAKWYDRTINTAASGRVMPNRGKFLDLDPAGKNRFGASLIRMTFDYNNERKISAHSPEVINKIAAALNPIHLTKATTCTSWSAVPYQTSHNPGGTIIGTNPGSSVAKNYGQVWAVDNLLIMGASLFPNNFAYNRPGRWERSLA